MSASDRHTGKDLVILEVETNDLLAKVRSVQFEIKAETVSNNAITDIDESLCVKEISWTASGICAAEVYVEDISVFSGEMVDIALLSHEKNGSTYYGIGVMTRWKHVIGNDQWVDFEIQGNGPLGIQFE